MRVLPLLGFVAALLVGSGPAVSAQMSDQDRRLGEQIVDSILSYAKYSVFDHIEIRIDNRHVILEGRVTIPLKKDEIERRVAKIDGIRSLSNEIGVLPVSQMDQRLRVAVANAIFGHPSFWRYAEQAVPPIHIIVEHQRITLAGVVDSQVDRMLAYSLAQVGGNLGVDNKLRVGR